MASVDKATIRTDDPEGKNTLGDTVSPTAAEHFARLRWHNRLSNKFLLLTMLAVMIAEVLIFVPFVANMRLRWLGTQLGEASAISEVLLTDHISDIPSELQNKILSVTGTKAVALHGAGASRMIAMSDLPDQIDEVVDLDHVSETHAIVDAIRTLFDSKERTLRITGKVPTADMPDRRIEIVMSNTTLRAAMLRFAHNVLIHSLIISIIAASLIYMIIHVMLLRPVRLLHRSMIEFAAAPDNPARILVPENRKDEFGIAQQQISHIQSDLQQTLKEQKRLADLGLAVSKINHDMRNILASAQLISDRLADIDDPLVQRFAPKLIRTLRRAINYSESVLAYGRSQEPPPKPQRILLHPVVEDVRNSLPLSSATEICFVNRVPENLEVYADSEQLFRVLTNLCRNSVQAMTHAADTIDEKILTITAGKIDSTTIIGVEDTGPGLPPKAREHLFAAFKGSTSNEGTGLGLAIAQELIVAHGGTIELRDDRAVGAHFEIRLPDEPTRR
ncbi:sensor histidine kinase [Daeguia caeni]|uniref:histidine kinase n=1 Tax=Daeguia caeni TaxID=439612 RepID=A0ABV9H4L5_9HYPH